MRFHYVFLCFIEHSPSFTVVNCSPLLPLPSHRHHMNFKWPFDNKTQQQHHDVQIICVHVYVYVCVCVCEFWFILCKIITNYWASIFFVVAHRHTIITNQNNETFSFSGRLIFFLFAFPLKCLWNKIELRSIENVFIVPLASGFQLPSFLSM